MKITNAIKITTVRDELDALGNLMEYELPQELVLDVVAKAVCLLNEVLDGEDEAVWPADSAIRHDPDPTVGRDERDLDNAVTLFCNLLKELKMEE